MRCVYSTVFYCLRMDFTASNLIRTRSSFAPASESATQFWNLRFAFLLKMKKKKESLWRKWRRFLVLLALDFIDSSRIFFLPWVLPQWFLWHMEQTWILVCFKQLLLFVFITAMQRLPRSIKTANQIGQTVSTSVTNSVGLWRNRTKIYWCHYIMDLYGHLPLLMTQYTVWILTTRHKIFEVLFVFALPLNHSFRFRLWLALKWGQSDALMAKVED